MMDWFGLGRLYAGPKAEDTQNQLEQMAHAQAEIRHIIRDENRSTEDLKRAAWLFHEFLRGTRGRMMDAGADHAIVRPQTLHDLSVWMRKPGRSDFLDVDTLRQGREPNINVGKRRGRKAKPRPTWSLPNAPFRAMLPAAGGSLASKREQEQARRKKAAQAKLNQRQQASRTSIPLPASSTEEAPPSIFEGEDLRTLRETLKFVTQMSRGEIPARTIKATWLKVKVNLPIIEADVKKHKIAILARVIGHKSSYYRKADYVSSTMDALIEAFDPRDVRSYQLMSNMTTVERVDPHVQGWTDEVVQRNKAQYEARQADRKKQIEALENPQTLEDFRNRIRYHKDGEASLTPEMQTRYEELQAEDSRAKRETQDAERRKIEAISQSDAEGIRFTGPQKTTHTKKGHDLWVVQLVDRVEKDVYTRLNSRAKRLGGYYSRYNKQGAIPGFQFTSEENAKAFMSGEILEQGTVDKSEQVADRLRETGQRTLERAEERLNQDRKTNTARRARMAAGVEEDERMKIFTAETMLKLADAIEAGEVKYLSQVNSRIAINELFLILRRAQHRRAEVLSKGSYLKRQELEGQALQEADLAYVQYPYPSIHGSHLLEFSNKLRKHAGFKRLATSILKEAKETPSGNIRFFTNGSTIAKLYKAKKQLPNGTTGYWYLDDTLETYHRLQRANIANLPELKQALKELLNLQATKRTADPLEVKRRDLQQKATYLKKQYDYFPTPPAVVQKILNAASLHAGAKVLEPGAGFGYIADAAAAIVGKDNVSVVELAPELREVLEMKGYKIAGWDFMEYEPGPVFDFILMNPPFSNRQDATHVLQAWKALKPGGRLVSIMGEGVFFRQHNADEKFRDWLDEQGGTSEKLPEGSFKSSDNPTGVNTRLVVIDKPEEVKPEPVKRRAVSGKSNYEDRKERRIERYEALADKRSEESEARLNNANQISERFAFGQPILVGHHSEKKARRDQQRMWDNTSKGLEAAKKAEYYQDKAESARSNTAISSDDESAIEKLKAKLAKEEKLRDQMKAVNKIMRSKKKTDEQKVAEIAETLGVKPELAAKLLEPDMFNRLGFPSYKITNLGANIRRIKKRIEELEAQAQEEYQSWQFGSIEVVADPEENRVAIFFVTKPSEEIRTKLKQYGFRWAPSAGAWQRKYNQSAIWDAKHIAQQVNEGTLSGLGAIYQQEGPGRRQCADGTWSDAGRGACAGHGGLKLNARGLADAACFALWFPVDQIQTDERRFQNRDAAYSEESVSRIMRAYNPDKMDPVRIWRDPRNEEVYMLSGHSRLEAMRRLEEAKIPARFFDGDEEQAIIFAKLEANRLGTSETLSETVKVYKMLRDKLGYSREQLKESFQNSKQSTATLEAYSHLNPKGKWMEILGSKARKSFPLVEVKAAWAGALRLKYGLSSAHENEIWAWLMEHPRGSQQRKEDFLAHIDPIINRLDFDPDKPLNLEKSNQRGVFARADTGPEMKRLKELDKDIRENAQLIRLAQTREEKRQRQQLQQRLLDEKARLEQNINLITKTQTALF